MRIRNHGEKIILRGFRVMLFRMVSKQPCGHCSDTFRFRVMLFRMVPKHQKEFYDTMMSFRAMLLKNKLSPQAIRNFHHKIRIFIIKDELLRFSKTNQVISQNVDRLRLVLPFFRKGFFY